MKQLIVLLMLLLSATPTFANDVPRDPWQPYRAVVQLDVREGRMSWQGSGTLIAVSGEWGLILSCRHVNTKVDLPVEVIWGGYNGVVTTGSVLYVMPGKRFGTDQALVVAKIPPGATPVPVGVASPENGPFRSVGYRGGQLLESIATEGYHNKNIFVLNSPYLGGMSGGATFDKYGRVVAIIVASNMRSIGYSSNGSNMRNMIDLYR